MFWVRGEVLSWFGVVFSVFMFALSHREILFGLAKVCFAACKQHSLCVGFYL